MQILTTATDEAHEVSFCGISSLSGLLIFSIKNAKRLVDYAIEFSSPGNTQTLRYQANVQEAQASMEGEEPESQQQPEAAAIEYTGYTEIISIVHNLQTDEVQIMLNKKLDA